MLSIRLFLAASSCLLLSACAQETAGPRPLAQAAAGEVSTGAPTPGSESSDAAPAKPAGAKLESVALTPENTKIEFVGTHVGAKPDPRTGTFTKFAGEAKVDRAKGTLQSASVEIQTDSLTTSIPKLTNHLKSPDFFDTREHPTARFESTRIAAADGEGRQTVTGKLTLLGKTNEVSFPVKVDVGERGLALSGTLTIDRTEFGMDKLQEGVKKEVEINVTIGGSDQKPAAK